MQDFSNYLNRIASYDWRILLAEWLLIGLAVWVVMRFMRGTRGARLMKGAAVLLIAGYALVNLVASRLGLERIGVLFDKILIGALFALAIVFQPELRRALMRLGETRLFRGWSSRVNLIIDKLVAAARYLSENRIGALIATERETGLAGLAESGVRLDAELTPDLVTTIFWPGSPLHDMGVIVQQDRVLAAGCQFPLAESGELPHGLGSRHRAALGLAMETDAVVIVISEETGSISVATRGKLIRPLTPDQLRRQLLLELAPRLAESDRRAASGPAQPAPQRGPAAGEPPSVAGRARPPASSPSKDAAVPGGPELETPAGVADAENT